MRENEKDSGSFSSDKCNGAIINVFIPLIQCTDLNRI